MSILSEIIKYYRALLNSVFITETQKKHIREQLVTLERLESTH